MIELPGYSIHRELSSASRPQVFLATQMSTGRDVVVKVFDPDTGSSQFDDEAFIQETSIIASMNHHALQLTALCGCGVGPLS